VRDGNLDGSTKKDGTKWTAGPVLTTEVQAVFKSPVPNVQDSPAKVETNVFELNLNWFGCALYVEMYVLSVLASVVEAQGREDISKDKKSLKEEPKSKAARYASATRAGCQESRPTLSAKASIPLDAASWISGERQAVRWKSCSTASDYRPLVQSATAYGYVFPTMKWATTYLGPTA
jgi:hypothetical protein